MSDEFSSGSTFRNLFIQATCPLSFQGLSSDDFVKSRYLQLFKAQNGCDFVYCLGGSFKIEYNSSVEEISVKKSIKFEKNDL